MLYSIKAPTSISSFTNFTYTIILPFLLIPTINIALGIIKKSGAWFSYNDEKIGQGKENTKATLEKDAALMNEIEEKIKEMTSAKPDEALPISSDDEVTETEE